MMKQSGKQSGKQNVSTREGKCSARCLAWVLLCLLAYGCVSTGQKAQPVAKTPVPQAGPGPSSAACTGVASHTGAPQQNCLPKGVIEITESYPVDPEVREEFHKAVSLLQQENYPEAIRLLRAVTGKASKFTGPHINLGIAYARSGELDKAEESLKKALELNAYHPVAMNELALVYRKTGRYAEARQLYENLVRWYPDYLPARKNFGVLCDIYIQDLNCALEHYKAYLEGMPEDEKVKIWVADVKSRM